MATKFEIEQAARTARAANKNPDSLPSPIRNRDPINLEEELLEQGNDGEENDQYGIDRYEEQKQIDRMNAQRALEEERKNNSPINQAQDAAKTYVKNAAKTAVKDAAYEGAVAAGSAIAASAPVWGSILVIIALIFGLVLTTVVAVKVVCDGNYTDSVKMFGAKLAVAWIPGDVCAQLSGTTTTPPQTTPPGGTGVITDAEARAILGANGITVTAGTLQGVRRATLDEAIRLKQGCDAWSQGNGGKSCVVVVTGGTGDKHAEGVCSHANGYKLDFRSIEGSALNNYIEKTFKPGTARTGPNGGPKFISGSSEYVRESNPAHWDMVTGCTANG